MHARKFAALLAVVVAMISLTACGAPRQQSTPTADASTIRTQVMQTVEFESTQEAARTPSVTPTLPPTHTPAVTATHTVPAQTATPKASPTRATSPDIAELLGQSIADRSRYTPGAPFTVTWTLKNAGTTTWGDGYTLKFFSGDQMGAQATIRLPKEVKPGDSVEVSVEFTAPSTIGLKRSNWVLQNKDGTNFYPMWIEIEVISDVPTPEPTSTEPTGLMTDTPSS